MCKHNIKVGTCYMNLDYGAFLVRHISVNGLLITLLDSYGDMHKTSYLTLQGATDIARETFDALYRRHHEKERISISQQKYYYARNNY